MYRTFPWRGGAGRAVACVTTFVAVSSPSRGAYAASCSSGDAPSAFATKACAISGTDVCVFSAFDTWECDVSTGGGQYGGVATAVTNFAGASMTPTTNTTYMVSAWGTSTDNVDWCCTVTSSNVEFVRLTGGTGNDVLSFTYTSGGTTRNLRSHTYVGAPLNAWNRLDGQIRADTGADDLYGSCSTDGAYYEALKGEDGNDDMTACAGLNDTMCDSSGTNSFDGGAGADKMWAAAGTPSGDGGTGTNVCGDMGWLTLWATSCTDSLTTVPPECTAF